jgi:hypothetical protein
MPEVGVEPTHTCVYWILSPARLPFRHSGEVAGNVARRGVNQSIPLRLSQENRLGQPLSKANRHSAMAATHLATHWEVQRL